MTFDPDREAREAEAHLRQLAAHPGWREYAADRARRMAAEDHGMWRPLAALATELRTSTNRERTRNAAA